MIKQDRDKGKGVNIKKFKSSLRQVTLKTIQFWHLTRFQGKNRHIEITSMLA